MTIIIIIVLYNNMEMIYEKPTPSGSPQLIYLHVYQPFNKLLYTGVRALELQRVVYARLT